MGRVFLLVSYSVFICGGSIYPSAEVVFGRLQDLTGCKGRLIAFRSPLEFVCRRQLRVYCFICRSLHCVTDRQHPEMRIYDLPSV